MMNIMHGVLLLVYYFNVKTSKKIESKLEREELIKNIKGHAKLKITRQTKRNHVSQIDQNRIS